MRLPQAEPVAYTDFGVGVPARQEVMFSDGSAVWLGRVQAGDAPDLFRRQILNDGHIVDLREHAPELERDLPVASTRDVPGIVYFSLRCHYRSSSEFLNAVRGGANHG